MTVQEIHIAIQMGLQKIGSYQYDDFQKEEIDLAFNIKQEEFVRQALSPSNIRPGFETIQSRVDDLRLPRGNAKLHAILDGETKVYGVLPTDYLYLINDRSGLYYSCAKDVDYEEDDLYLGAISLSFPDSEAEENFYSELKILYSDDSILFNIEDYEFEGLDSKEEKYLLLRTILDKLRSIPTSTTNPTPKYNVYWEEFGSYYKKNTFFITSFSGVGTLKIIIDGADPVESENFLPEEAGSINYKVASSEDSYKEVPNRLLKTEELFNILNHSFGRTSDVSPISNLENDKIIVYRNNFFVPKEINISYIRRPRNINYNLGISCELSPHVHNIICDATVKYLLEAINSPRFESKIVETKINQ